jgi:hypothetical protein
VAGTIITGVHLTGITLSQNPTTIAATGTITAATGDAIYADYFNSRVTWTITNLGKVDGTGTNFN